MPNDLKSIKAYLRAQPALKLDDRFTLTDKTPQEFVRNFILDYNSRYITVYADSGLHQCYMGKSRSASDIFIITNFYFPKVKLISVYRVIFALLKEKKISTDICRDVHKRIYWKTGSGYNSYYGAATDETGLDFRSIPEFEGIPAGTDTYGLKYFIIPKID